MEHQQRARMALLSLAVSTIAGICVFTISVSGHSEDQAAPSFDLTLPGGYRDWKLISVAHEAGNSTIFERYSATMRQSRRIAKARCRFRTAP